MRVNKGVGELVRACVNMRGLARGCKNMRGSVRPYDSVQGCVSVWENMKECTRTHEGVQCRAIACEVILGCVRMCESV